MLSSSLFLASFWSSWKGLVISISSKCDIPPLPFWTPALATLSLFKKRLFCVHVTTTHAVVPAMMVANRLWLITVLQMSHRGRRDVERGALRYFWPHQRLFPSVPTFPHCSDLWTSSTDETSVWGGAQSLDPLCSLAGLVWRAACFGLCHTHKHSYTNTVFGLKGLSWHVLGVLWVMTNVIMLPFLLLYHMLPEYITMFS